MKCSTTYVLVVAAGIILFSCSNERQNPMMDESTKHNVDFLFTIEGDCSTPFLEMVFDNKTTDAKSFIWDFGDGTTSTEINPKKVYAKAGNYFVTMTALFVTDTVPVRKEVNISRNSDGKGPSISLSYAMKDSTSFTFVFNITTNETSYGLDFGDGMIQESAENEITHSYGGPGRYIAYAFAQNSEGRSCASVVVDVGP